MSHLIKKLLLSVLLTASVSLAWTQENGAEPEEGVVNHHNYVHGVSVGLVRPTFRWSGDAIKNKDESYLILFSFLIIGIFYGNEMEFQTTVMFTLLALKMQMKNKST